MVFPKDLFEHGDGTELLADFESSDCQNLEARNNLEDSSIPYSCKSSQLSIAGRNQDCNCGKKKLYLEINQFYLPLSGNLVYQSSDANIKIKNFPMCGLLIETLMVEIKPGIKEKKDFEYLNISITVAVFPSIGLSGL